MKFGDLAVGQRFEVDGVPYVKTTPVLASPESGGASRFVPRYALVTTAGAPGHEAVARADRPLSSTAGTAAFEACHMAWRAELEGLAGEIPATRLRALLEALESGKEQFFEAIARRPAEE